ncbi:aminotransferase class III-fold pyridoxal phosphate-dependent enzyme [Sandaracinobacteroides hominis]|uniref:aminotransferase class III-fold pyridoxal phosphate-dependent enzyme n=1 Tax=Sandaracinobacteroides hominis TaxID=2780086 RepID=UPI0018F63F2B|nr:aminotransferase class III-fold pyridoxal phosphate-dependent enzyme [Sandaracinobacteroides hominis]
MQLRADTALRERAARVIPNGMYGHQATHLLPPGFPQFFSSAHGARIRDADGNSYIDLMCAYGPNLFGYADPEIDAAYIGQLRLGDTMTGPSPLMVELAERLTARIGHADWVIFCKNGTDATTMALEVARATTGRRKVLTAYGAYHGSAPWCTPVKAGTLPEDRAHLPHFLYNDIASLEAAVAEAGTDLAAIVASPFRHDAFFDQEEPTADYARAVRALADRAGALLIVDDVRAGFRVARDCSWSKLGVAPDLSSWGKCIANGHPISFLAGSDSARKGAEAIYATGSFWFSAAPMAAALATLDRIENSYYLERLNDLGNRLRRGLDTSAARHGFSLKQTGPVQMPQILHAEDPDFARGFAFAEEMLARGIYLHPWHNMFLNAAMTETDIDQVIAAADDAFPALRERLSTLAPHPGVVALMSSVAG